MPRKLTLLPPFILVVLLVGCSGSDGTRISTGDASTQAASDALGLSEQLVNGPEANAPPPTPTLMPADSEAAAEVVPLPAEAPTTTFVAAAIPTPTPTTVPPPLVLPLATPAPADEPIALPRQEPWVIDRVNAVVFLYSITPAGNDALGRLDMRRMRDEPGFFGSFGYKGWSGVGEARPIGVIHELGHAYWGLFPVTGFPDLKWDPEGGKSISPAIERYHRDLLEFMAQPPDPYELLRGRLRDLPQVSLDNTEPLFHHMEGDAIYTTAGDLKLMPPILRKYWDQYLTPGPFHTWEEAFRWYMALPDTKKALANKYIGFEHFDPGRYVFSKVPEPTDLPNGVEAVVVQEEMRRLQDFVEVFDLLLGSSEHKEDFKFWRRYLRDKIDLHKQHPGLLASLNSAKADQIAGAVGFLNDIDGDTPERRSDLVLQKLEGRPFLAHFLPALDDRTLLELFTSDASLPEGATLKGTAAFVESLKSLAPPIDAVLESGRRDPSEGAEELGSFLRDVSFEAKERLELFFEVLQGSDNATARAVVALLDASTLRKLHKSVPAKLRRLLGPSRTLEFLDITIDSSPNKLKRGIEDIVAYPSGNFRIDEPYLEEMYRVVAARSKREPRETLRVVADSAFPMERFIALHPVEAVEMLGSDLGIASEMVVRSDPIIFSPARFVYRLIYAEPEFAARIVARLDARQEDDLVLESLAHFAYDADRVRAFPGLRISLERDGRFLQGLLRDKGAEWMERRLGEAVALYRERVRRDSVPEDFLEAYERTLRAGASRLEDGMAHHVLEGIVARIFLRQ